MCSARVSEMMQRAAKPRPVDINIYAPGIVAVGWRSSCDEIKYGDRRGTRRAGAAR